MMTTATTADQFDPSRAAALPSAAQKVVIVNGSAEMLGLIETALDAGHYDVVFVESTEHAYSQIKRVQPHLVILCVHIDDAEGLQVLSMLKLDAETRDIPVVTYTTEYDGEDVDDDDEFEPPETELFTPKPALWKN
jgi:PleD family two-component response regulator